MEHELINQEYLTNLIALSREQKDDDLVAHLFQSLQREYDLFLTDCEPLIEKPDSRKEFQTRIHKLKNNFYNLGCEEAGADLEDMYQMLKADAPDQAGLHQAWDRFEKSAQLTFSFLKKSLTNH